MTNVEEYFRRVIGEFEQPVKDKLNNTISTESIFPVLGKPKINRELDKKIEEEKDELERISKETWKEMERSGLDIVAFYAPYHIYGRNWGIYFYETKIFSFAYIVWQRCGGSFSEVLNTIFKFILTHEMFHFKVELLFTIDEEVGCGVSYSSHVKNNSSQELEEALATSVSLRKRIIPTIKAELEKICQNLPNGYGKWNTYASPRAFDTGLRRLFPHRRLPYIFVHTPILTPYISQEVPNYVIFLPSKIAGDILCLLTANKRIDDLLRCIRKKFNVKIEVSHGAKHMKIYFPGQVRPITFSYGLRKGIPPYILSEISRALNMDRKRLLRECFGIPV